MDGVVKSSSDENHALLVHTRKGRRGSPDRRGSSRRRTSPISRVEMEEGSQ